MISNLQLMPQRASGKAAEPGYTECRNQAGEYTSAELIEYWTAICDKYPMYSVEDPLDEEDWDGWHEITLRLGDRIKIVGDDFFLLRIPRGLAMESGEGVQMQSLKT